MADGMHIVHSSSTGVTLKKADAELLSRIDVQYDLLTYLFDDKTEVFTDHARLYNPELKRPVFPRVTFRQLYLTALHESVKLSGVIKDRMKTDTEFGLEFAKIALLVNVGRINTTMAFFPDMRTSSRTYNPIPSLQKTEGNVQDAPRIKSALKGAFLPSERTDSRSNTLQDLQNYMETRGAPTCSITNLIFILSLHLEDGGICDGATLSFAQLFCPHPVSSASRARAVLWNLFHYMEGSKVANPFADARDPYRPPPLLLADEVELEYGNRDTEEELEWCAVMKARRHQFMRTVQQEEKAAAALVDQMVNPPAEPAPSGRRKQSSRSKHAQESTTLADTQRRARAQAFIREPAWATMGSVPAEHISHVPSLPRVPHVEYPPQQTMLQYAWETTWQHDPLSLSDGEDDSLNARFDYERRVAVINRLRGRPPTPPLSLQI